MSKSTFGWRKAGFAAVATALVAGGALAGISTAAAVPAEPGQLDTESPAPSVLKGQTDAPAGDLDFEFLNSWTTGSSVTFTIAGNTCSNAAGIAKAIEFASAPSVSVTGPTTGIDSTTPGTAGAATPVFTTTLGSSGATPPGECATAGIQD